MYIPAKKQDRCFQKKQVTRGIINTKKKITPPNSILAWPHSVGGCAGGQGRQI